MHDLLLLAASVCAWCLLSVGGVFFHHWFRRGAEWKIDGLTAPSNVALKPRIYDWQRAETQ